MRGHKLLLFVFLAAAIALPQPANAQLRGLMGVVTRPLGAMLGHFGHFPRHHSRLAHEARSASTPAAQTQPARPQLGTVGPPAWTSAYEDVLGYTFWPGEYAERVRAHGFDVMAAAVLGAPRGGELARVATTGSAVEDSDANSSQACGQEAAVQVTWPVSQIEQTSQLNGAQREALGKLQIALAESIKTIKAGCRDLASLAPLDRVTASLQELWAVRDAGIYVRAPLKAFYDSLTDAQKAGFAWKEPRVNLPQGAKAATAGADSAMARQYQACAAPSLESAERLLREIEGKIRPREQQNASMEAVRKTSTDMAKMLTAACAQPIPADPVARLDSANDQLSSMSYAATSLVIALDGFHAQLDAEQKTRFDSLGR